MRARRRLRNDADNSIEHTSEPCKHPMVIGSLCAVCGNSIVSNDFDESDNIADNKEQTKVTMVGGGTVILSSECARLLHADKARRLLQTSKLALVLDLDNTLVHATPDAQSRNCEGDDYFTFDFPGKPGIHCAKLRPHVREFLKGASEQFELSIYTAGTREYAEIIAQHLDPDNSLFSRRIISACDTVDLERGAKSLNRIFPGSTNMVLVVDDREDVWRGDQSKNLLLVRPYVFWKSTYERSNRTVENDPQLLCTLKILREIHTKFYVDSEPQSQDVRLLLANIRIKLLNDVCIVFTGLIPLQWDKPVEAHPLWRFAVSHGATVSTTVDFRTTHVLAMRMGSEKTLEGLKIPGCRIVHVDWLMFSVWHCRREDESQFLLTPKNQIQDCTVVQNLQHLQPDSSNKEKHKKQVQFVMKNPYDSVTKLEISNTDVLQKFNPSMHVTFVLSEKRDGTEKKGPENEKIENSELSKNNGVLHEIYTNPYQEKNMEETVYKLNGNENSDYVVAIDATQNDIYVGRKINEEVKNLNGYENNENSSEPPLKKICKSRVEDADSKDNIYFSSNTGISDTNSDDSSEDLPSDLEAYLDEL